MGWVGDSSREGWGEGFDRERWGGMGSGIEQERGGMNDRTGKWKGYNKVGSGEV